MKAQFEFDGDSTLKELVEKILEYQDFDSQEIAAQCELDGGLVLEIRVIRQVN